MLTKRNIWWMGFKISVYLNTLIHNTHLNTIWRLTPEVSDTYCVYYFEYSKTNKTRRQQNAINDCSNATYSCNLEILYNKYWINIQNVKREINPNPKYEWNELKSKLILLFCCWIEWHNFFIKPIQINTVPKIKQQRTIGIIQNDGKHWKNIK